MTPLPLRIALGIVAAGLIVLAVGGAYYSVQINYLFGLTLAPAAGAGAIIASCLAAIEIARIGMPFARTGLQLAGLPYKWAGVAFWLFTCVSVLSAGAYFKMNRDAAGKQRVTQESFSAGFATELRDITTRLKVEITRSVGEVEAELKGVGRNDTTKRVELETEKAAIEGRARDIKRLQELQQLDVWKVTVGGKDAQASMVADALPWFEREKVEAFAAFAVIFLVIVCVELLVGRTPHMAVMVLAWACKREKPVAEAPAAPATVVAAPDDHVSRFIAGCITRSNDGATQWKQLYGGYTKFCASKGWQPLNEFRLRPALQAALGGSVQTEKRHRGMFYLTLVLKPQWLPEVSHAA